VTSQENRRRARRGPAATYDGVTDSEIYRRDSWTCQMPACLCPDGRAIDPELTGHGTLPWAPSVDHIVPVVLGGRDDAANKRAAHQLCNADAAVPMSRKLNRALAPSLRPAPRTIRERPRAEPLPPAGFDLSVAARIPAGIREKLESLR
jgi:5-methylcytosine-specific restriction endonuclease McrA